MPTSEIENLITLLAKMPGLGPRSARRAALYLVKQRTQTLRPLAEALTRTAERVHPCSICGNLDTVDPCVLCVDPERDKSLICVVEGVADLWAIERTNVFCGRYHVLGGTLSALDGVGPDDLNVTGLIERAQAHRVTEVILAISATVAGQTTAHYVTECLATCDVIVTRLAHGVPVGSELEYLDEGTLSIALKARTAL